MGSTRFWAIQRILTDMPESSGLLFSIILMLLHLRVWTFRYENTLTDTGYFLKRYGAGIFQNGTGTKYPDRGTVHIPIVYQSNFGTSTSKNILHKTNV